MRETEAVLEARREMVICNACRYCEGFCATMQAMERRRVFSSGDLSYLANLCHDCRGCYYACQFAPPHEFNLNFPEAMARVRSESWAEYAWPQSFAGVFKRNGMIVSLLTALGIALVFILTAALKSSEVLYGSHQGPESFYAIMPEWLMIAVGGVTLGFALVAMWVGFLKFWRDTGGGPILQARSLFKTVSDVLLLSNLGGGGLGCNNHDEAYSQTRRYAHQTLFYGFLLCFASTCVAGFYGHILGWAAPYPLLSLPVLLGTAGGIGMVIGILWLLAVKITSGPEPAAKELLGSDYALLVLLFLAALTGLLLLVLRDSAAMGTLLALHLGVILAFFLTLPYSKFVHVVYRSAALLRNAAEGADE